MRSRGFTHCLLQVGRHSHHWCTTWQGCPVTANGCGTQKLQKNTKKWMITEIPPPNRSTLQHLLHAATLDATTAATDDAQSRAAPAAATEQHHHALHSIVRGM